jgi:predicted homoserine dehydrogenase-like protein
MTTQITARMRLDELYAAYRALLAPSQKFSKRQLARVRLAANLRQVVEMAVVANAAGAKHDRAVIEAMKGEIHQLLTAAGIRSQAAANVR